MAAQSRQQLSMASPSGGWLHVACFVHMMLTPSSLRTGHVISRPQVAFSPGRAGLYGVQKPTSTTQAEEMDASKTHGRTSSSNSAVSPSEALAVVKRPRTPDGLLTLVSVMAGSVILSRVAAVKTKAKREAEAVRAAEEAIKAAQSRSGADGSAIGLAIGLLGVVYAFADQQANSVGSSDGRMPVLWVLVGASLAAGVERVFRIVADE